MDYFELEDQKQKEVLEEKKFQELYAKQAKISKIVLLACFLPMGIVFIIVGIILAMLLEEDLAFEGYIFLILGVIFAILGVVLYFVIPKKGNYERYKRSLNRYGGLNNYNIAIRVGLLEERVKNLEEENSYLKNKINKM